MASVSARKRNDQNSEVYVDSSSDEVTVVKVATSLILGVVFGIAVEKGRVFEPDIIVNQMLFNKFVMLKMFLSATLSGMFCLSLMSMIPATRKKYLAAKRNFASCLKEKSYTTVMIGAALLGAGMSVAGTCPGLVLAQVGAGTTNAGGSSSYCTIVSTMLYYRSVKKFSPYLYKFQSGMSNWWQVLYISGAIGGAALSSMMSGSFGITHGVSVVEALLGGFLIVFGARLAGGCTSGHGLSGMGLLNLLSVAGVVAMFAGGIFTAMNKLILVHLLKSLF
ncbi:hypothetical protein KUTeg_013150 [Tegillarca granosa]|uniref:Sulphur transport domain-containing protein n=1 Tax=Tegillarca granosa TaxID=220873 RepID=A0ABQ9EWD2_TEGGR|nr:hypothetical protein KUTeg_013150 [Tegillarca granosa]